MKSGAFAKYAGKFFTFIYLNKRRKGFIITFINFYSEVTEDKVSFKQCCGGSGCRGGKNGQLVPAKLVLPGRRAPCILTLEDPIIFQLSAEPRRGHTVLLFRLSEGIADR